jgi:hypothetical protein
VSKGCYIVGPDLRAGSINSRYKQFLLGGGSCTVADIFTECFDGATPGAINGASPGPLNGWTFIEPFGATGGEVVFAPGSMSVDTLAPADFPIVNKPLLAAPASYLGICGRFAFTEYTSNPNPSTTYQLAVNIGGVEVVAVSFFGDGNIAVQAGDINITPFYSGSFTPSQGASHVVDFGVAMNGTPTLYLDGVEIPLTPLGSIPSFWNLYPSDGLSYGGGAAEGSVQSSEVPYIYVMTGEVDLNRVFCCP